MIQVKRIPYWFINAMGCLALLLGWQMAGAATKEPTAQTIEVGAFVNDISNLDVTKGTVTLDLYLWIVSPTPFDAKTGFEIINGTGTVRLVETRHRDDGKSYQLLRIVADSKQRYDLRDYPFDQQTLALEFDFDPSSEATSLDVTADVSNSALASNITLPGWRVSDLTVNADRQTYPTSWGSVIHEQSDLSYPQFTVSVQAERETLVYLVRYFSVIIFAGLLAMLGLFLKPSETTRISLGIGAYISLSASSLVIANKLPVTDALNFSDHIILVTGAVILATVLYSLTTYHLYSKTPAKAGTIDRIARIIFPIAWLSALAIIFNL
ncbi:MAG TPA: hypothetical protein VIC30_03130 [Orrella sp.]